MSELYARFTSLEGGMNSGFDPAVIPDKQYALGVNVICRRGRPTTRPDFVRPKLAFATDEDRVLFESGRFQGAAIYAPGAVRRIVAVIGGYVFIITIPDMQVIRLAGIRLIRSVPRCYFCQAVEYMIVQDGVSRPVIITNLTGRYADREKDEVPAGTIMGFGHGRLFVKVGDRTFIAGDIYKYYQPSSVLKFTEDQYLSEGGAFAVPSDLGAITAMHFATMIDTATGDGPLLICCENGIVSYAVQNSRTLWNNNDISKVQLSGTGIVGPGAIADINQDMMFWSHSGLRSLATARQEAAYRRKYTNLSAELGMIIADETSFIQPMMSMIRFNNRLLFTMVGEKARCLMSVPWSETEEWVFSDYSFKCIGSLDFDQINNQTADSTSKTVTIQSASFDGIWTGIHPTQLLSTVSGGAEMAFVFDKSRTGKNRLWEITDKNSGYDNGVHPIEASIDTKSYASFDAQYYEQPFVLKRLQSIRLWISKVSHPVVVGVSVKNEQATNYSEIQRRGIDIRTWERQVSRDGDIQSGRPINPGIIPFEEFAQVFLSHSERLAHIGYELSFRIFWKGYLEIARMLSEFSNEGQLQYAEPGHSMMVGEVPEDKYNYRV